MNLLPQRVPPGIAFLLSKVPAYPGSLVFVAGLNLALLKLFPKDVMRSLEGKRLRISVRDASLNFDFQVTNGYFSVSNMKGSPDLCITANAYDFSLLAFKKVDPDTLFFNRRLSREGDTELGILVKNTLDTIEFPEFKLAALRPSAVLKHIKSASGAI